MNADSKNKTVIGIHRDELRKERYEVLVRGLNIALKEIDSNIRIRNVSKLDDVHLSLELSKSE